MTLPSYWPALSGPALFLAPMAGFCDPAFRKLCRAQGAQVLVSEFAMANGVLEAQEDSRFWRALAFAEEERPFGIQLFGAEPEFLARAAVRIREKFRPDFIDLNYGCPAPKIVCQNAGSALMKDLPLAVKIAEAVVRAVPDTPVTAKMRAGWDFSHVVAPEFAQRLEGVGVRALAVHGRTRIQGYGGDADWELVGRVVKAVSVPVVGNGSVGGAYPVEAIRASGVAGVMVGRAALGNPWVFARLRAELSGGAPPLPPTIDERLRTMLSYARDLAASGEGFSHIKPRLKPFISDFPGARRLRHAIDGAKNPDELEALAKAPDDTHSFAD